ncbi:MAG: ABC transporter ATP-binding protein [Lachnospiraceae bacterium]|nr:ABC transporter ATP-binding protein [Lachnospiraceae bacterium]
MVKVTNLSKNYGDVAAVKGLSFELEKGKIYGFLGPNGAGKSTTMNIMTGYIAPSAGTVVINGHDIRKEPEKAKQNIGYLPELPPLYTDMRVGEYINFAQELKKVPRDNRPEELSKILKLTGLEEYEHRMIRNLSKGYKQRVGLAQALVGDPEVIILDEPTVGLDPQQIIEMRNLMRSLKEEHIVILSTHILTEVTEVCDEVLIISNGELAARGTPDELENKLQKKTRIDIEVLGTEEKVCDALKAVDSIDRIFAGDRVLYVKEGLDDETGGSVGKSDGGESVKITVETSSEDDIRTDVAKALAAAALPVLSMNVESSSMEDVFLSVTQQTRGKISNTDDADSNGAPEAENESETDEDDADEDTDTDGEDSDDEKGDEE